MSFKKRIIVLLLIITFGISIIYVIRSLYYDRLEITKLEEYYTYVAKIEDTDGNKESIISEYIENDSYIASISIPKINLEKGIYSKESKYNDVSYGIEIIKESTYPNIDGGNFILASHSGNSRVSHFKDLDKLTIGDEVYINYLGTRYKYVIDNIYDIQKTGVAKIERKINETTLTLITCRRNTDKQIVIIGYLQNT